MKTLSTTSLFAWALVVALPLWFSSCKKSDNNDTVTPTTIEGNYKISALKASPKILGQFDDLLALAPQILGSTCLTDITLSFKSGGTVTTDTPATCTSVDVSDVTGVDGTSKWSQSGNKLTITQSDGSKTDYTVLSTGAVLQLQWQGSEDYAGTGTNTTYTYTMDLKRV